MSRIIRNEDMPDPDTLVMYGCGMCGAAMFHYCCNEDDGTDPEDIARENGFDIQFHRLPDDHPLMPDYEEGASDVVERWEPDVPEGWTLGGKHDTEDGPTAFYIKPRPPKLQVIQDADHPF